MPPRRTVHERSGTVHAEAAGFTTFSQLPLDPIIALRAGGDKVWGTPPFQDLATVGGSTTVRGFYHGRFAGDAAVYLQAEVLLKLAQVGLIAPSDVGILGINDVGRVFVTGQHSSVWHDGFGGGFWASFQNRRYLVNVSIVHSVERTVLYGGVGLGW